MTDQLEAPISHPVGGQLDGLSERIARLDLTGHDGVRPHVDRMAEAVGYAAERVAASRPELVSTTMLDRLTGPLDQMSVPLDQFEAENNAAYLEQAATYCDALLDATALLPAPRADDAMQAVQERAAFMRQTFGTLVEDMRAEKAELESQVEEFRTAIEETKAEMAAKTAAFEAEVERVRASVVAQTARFDLALDAFTAESSAAVKAADKEYATSRQTQLAEAKAAAEALLTDFSEATSTTKSEFDERAVAAVARLEELRDKAANLVGVVTGTATAGGYKKVADEERTAANIWRLVSLASVAVVAAIGIWTVASTGGDGSFEWGHLAAKAFLALPFAAAAAYAAQQSSGHRQTESRTRHAQLQLAALEPYVESLSEEDAKKVRADLAAHLFGPAVSTDAVASSDPTVKALIGLTRDVTTAALDKR